MSHYTASELEKAADGGDGSLSDRLALAIHLTTCTECLATLRGLEPLDPEAAGEPLARALRRATLPYWGWTLLGCQFKCVFLEPAPELPFAFLVLDEALDLAVRDPSPGADSLYFPRLMADQLPDSDTAADLRARVSCAAARLAILGGRPAVAAEWLEKAEPGRAGGTEAPDVRLDLLLTKYQMHCADEDYSGHLAEGLRFVGAANVAAFLKKIVDHRPGTADEDDHMKFFALALLALACADPCDVFHKVLLWLRWPVSDLSIAVGARSETLYESLTPARFSGFDFFNRHAVILLLANATEGSWAMQYSSLLVDAFGVDLDRFDPVPDDVG